MVFVSLMGLMHEDQSLLPEHYTFLGPYSLIFTHCMHLKTENSQVQSSLLKAFPGLPVEVIHRDNKTNGDLSIESPESLELLSEKSPLTGRHFYITITDFTF